jgi:hypothetical protein
VDNRAWVSDTLRDVSMSASRFVRVADDKEIPFAIFSPKTPFWRRTEIGAFRPMIGGILGTFGNRFFAWASIKLF